jgi:hypothetical protein
MKKGGVSPGVILLECDVVSVECFVFGLRTDRLERSFGIMVDVVEDFVMFGDDKLNMIRGSVEVVEVLFQLF